VWFSLVQQPHQIGHRNWFLSIGGRYSSAGLRSSAGAADFRHNVFCITGFSHGKLVRWSFEVFSQLLDFFL
jgi:hypothetical protein